MSDREAAARGRRTRKLRKGIWVRNMNEDEYALYKGSCELLGLPVRTVHGDKHGPDYTVSQDNVIGLFPTEQNIAGMVPAGGDSKHGNTDHRVRKQLKPVRLGKRWSEILEAVKNEDYTWDEFVSTLSPEELARGQLKDKHGSFQGRPPSMVPRVFHDACVRELLSRGRVLYKANYIAAIEAMTSIAQSPNAKDSDRLKAATFVIERLEGKVPDKLEIAAADPWQQIINGIVAEVPDEMVAAAQEYLNRRGEDTSA